MIVSDGDDDDDGDDDVMSRLRRLSESVTQVDQVDQAAASRKRTHAETVRAVRRLTDVQLGFGTEQQQRQQPFPEAPIELEQGQTHFYVDGIHPRASRQDPSKRARLMPPQQIPREDGRLWPPDQEEEDSETFAEEWRENFFKRRDLLAADPDFKFLELVAGAANTDVEKLFDPANLEGEFLRVQNILSQQRRRTTAQRERFALLRTRSRQTRRRVSQAERLLDDLEPETELASEGTELLAKLDVTREEETHATEMLRLIKDTQTLIEFFLQEFKRGNGGVDVYNPSQYSALYSTNPHIEQAIRRTLAKMARQGLPGADGLLKLLDIEELSEENKSDWLSRSLFYIISNYLSDVREGRSEIPRMLEIKPEKEEGPSSPPTTPTRKRVVIAQNIREWMQLARSPHLHESGPVDGDYIGKLWASARPSSDREKEEALVVLRDAGKRSERARNRAVSRNAKAESETVSFVSRKLRQKHATRRQYVSALRKWLENYTRDRRIVLRAVRDWRSSMDQLSEELEDMERIREPDLPYQHRMRWALRPEFSGRVELRALVIYGIAQAWTKVRKWVPDLARAGMKRIQRDAATQTDFATVVANVMALSMSKFPVRWLPAKLRGHAIRDLGNAMRDLEDIRWDPYGERFVLTSEEPVNTAGAIERMFQLPTRRQVVV